VTGTHYKDATRADLRVQSKGKVSHAWGLGADASSMASP